MAETKKDAVKDEDPNAAGAPEVSNADHAGQLGKIKDNPDKPDPSTVAQVQVLSDEDKLPG